MIIVAGEALIDLVATDANGGYRAVPGGSPANVAVGLARLEQPVRLLARLGPDAFGRRVREHLVGNGVDLAWAVDATEPTSLAVASLDPTGQATYDFYLTGTADWQWTAAELPAALGGVTALHSGSLALGLPPGAVVLEDLFRREHAEGARTLSVDLNLRPSILTDRNAERARVERQVRLAHLVKASDEDLGWLYPGQPIAEITARWRAAGVTCCVVTMGGGGAYLLAPDGVAYRQTARPIEVADTVGAGDSFTGGMLDALARLDALGSDPVARLAAVSSSQWLEVLDHAGTVAAITCTRRGADPPTRADVAALTAA
jgi:fructokinase